MNCPVCKTPLGGSHGCYHYYDGFYVAYWDKDSMYPVQTKIWVGDEIHASIVIDAIVQIERIHKLLVLK